MEPAKLKHPLLQQFRVVYTDISMGSIRVYLLLLFVSMNNIYGFKVFLPPFFASNIFTRQISTLRVSTTLYSSKTGAFKSRLPDIFPSATHFKRALRGLKKVRYDESIKNSRNLNRKYTAESGTAD